MNAYVCMCLCAYVCVFYVPGGGAGGTGGMLRHIYSSIPHQLSGILTSLNFETKH